MKLPKCVITVQSKRVKMLFETIPEKVNELKSKTLSKFLKNDLYELFIMDALKCYTLCNMLLNDKQRIE